MNKRAGKRIQIKQIKFLIKQAIASNSDPFPYLLKLRDLEGNPLPEISEPSCLKLIFVDFRLDYPDYRQIPQTDPRYNTYRNLYLFGPDDWLHTTSSKSRVKYLNVLT